MMALSSKLLYLLTTNYDLLEPWEHYFLKSIAEVCTNSILMVTPIGYITLYYFLMYNTMLKSKTNVVLFIWSLSEVVFHLYNQYRHHQLGKDRGVPKLGERERTEVMLKLYTEAYKHDPKFDLSSWILNPQNNGDKAHFAHFRDLIISSAFDKPLSVLSEEEYNQSENLLAMLSEKFDWKVPESWWEHPNERVIVDTFNPPTDPVKVYYKPFLLQMFISSIHVIGDFGLKYLGFKWNSIPNSNLSYWICQPINNYTSDEEGEEADKLVPLIYAYGIGFGWASYLYALYKLRVLYPKRTIILLNLPVISMYPTASNMIMDDLLYALDHINIDHNLSNGYVWLTHSFGTMVGAWVMKHRPQYIKKLVLIDPVIFLPFDGFMTRTLLYAPPQSFAHQLCQFLAMRDSGISNNILRNFRWYEGTLHCSDIIKPAHIFLGKQEWAINTESCYRYLIQNESPLVKMDFAEMSHGTSLIDSELLDYMWSKV